MRARDGAVMASGLFVHDVTVPGCVVLSLCGELDVFTAPALRAQLAELAARGQCRLVFDLAPLSFIDAHGAGVLLAAAVQAHERGGWARLIGVRRRTYRGPHIRRLIRRLPVYRTLEDALDAPPRHLASVLVRRFGETRQPLVRAVCIDGSSGGGQGVRVVQVSRPLISIGNVLAAARRHSPFLVRRSAPPRREFLPAGPPRVRPLTQAWHEQGYEYSREDVPGRDGATSGSPSRSAWWRT